MIIDILQKNMFDKNIPLPEIIMLKIVSRDYIHLREYFHCNCWNEDKEKQNHYEVFIPYRSRDLIYNGLFLILKSSNGITEKEKKFESDMKKEKFKVVYCYNFNEVKNTILCYLE